MLSTINKVEAVEKVLEAINLSQQEMAEIIQYLTVAMCSPAPRLQFQSRGFSIRKRSANSSELSAAAIPILAATGNGYSASPRKLYTIAASLRPLIWISPILSAMI